MMVAIATSAALLSAVPGRAGSDVEELAAKKDRLVDLASNLARELIPMLKGSSKDFRPWIVGDGYKRLVGLNGETERLAKAMLDNDKTMKVGENLNRLDTALKRKVTALPKVDGEIQTRDALKAIYQLLRQFEEIKVTY